MMGALPSRAAWTLVVLLLGLLVVAVATTKRIRRARCSRRAASWR